MEAASVGIRAQTLQNLRSVASAGSAPDPRALARVIVDHLRGRFAVDRAALALWDASVGKLQPLAESATGAPKAGPPTSTDQRLLELAFTRREPVVVDDYPSWEHAQPAVRRAGLVSAVAVPLCAGDRALGALSLQSLVRRPFSSAEVQLLSLIGAQLGLVLDAGRLFAEAERRQQEAEALAAALARSEQQLRSLYEAIACGILVRDRSGKIVHANAAAEEILGLTAARMIGRMSDDLWAAVAEDGDILAAADRPGMVALRTGSSVQSFTMGVDRPNVPRRWLQITSVPVRGPDGQPSEIVSSFIDVTARKEAERQLQTLSQTEKLRALGQMASGVAHDLNQYLGLIAGHGELALYSLSHGEPDLDRLRESLETIVNAATTGAQTIKRLLAFARPTRHARLTRFTLSSLLDDVVRLTAPTWRDATVAEGRQICLDVDAEGDTTIEGSPEDVREAFTNLLFNAVDALPSGGRIRLTARRRGETVETEVTDTGIGIEESVRPHIFEPFFTTKGERGTGLGLAVVFGVVEQHRGQISLDTVPGRGTTFRLTFPAAPGVGAPTEAAPPAVEVRPLRILAVDDEPALAKMIALMLGTDGHTVAIAYSAAEALQILETTPCDLVISDVGMGPGPNGWELGETVRRRFPATRFYLATGWGDQIDPAQAKLRGVHGIIAKPYRIADLQRVVVDR